MSENVFSPRFKRDLLQRVIQDLYDESEQYFKNWMDSLCRRHRDMTGHAAFSYRSRVYVGAITQGAHYRADPLAPALREEMDEYLQAYRRFSDEDKAVIQQYLTNALNICKNPADLLMVLPDQTHQVVERHLIKVLDKFTPTITEFEARQFREQNIHYDNVFKERLLINLISK